MGLLPHPPGKIECSVIEFEDQTLLKLSEAEKRNIRLNEISMIIQ